MVYISNPGEKPGKHLIVCALCCSYELSRQLEPEGLPTHLLTVQDPNSPTTNGTPSGSAPVSPSRIRRGLRHIFNLKGSSVGDYAPQLSPPRSSSPSPSHHSSPLSTSSSARDLSSTTPPILRITRAASYSPSTQRKRGSPPARCLFTTTGTQQDNDDGGCGREETKDGGGGGDVERSREDLRGRVMQKEDSGGRVVRVAFTNSDHCNYKRVQP